MFWFNFLAGAPEKEGFALSAEQTTANPLQKSKKEPKKKGKGKGKRKTKKQEKTKETRIDFYLNHVKRMASKIFDLGIKYIVADAFFAKEKYVNGVFALGLHVISKLRKDARLLHIYTGPQKARGRKRKTTKEKVGASDFKDSAMIKVGSEEIELRSCVAYSVSLKRDIKIVWIKELIDINRYKEAFLFSTDINADMQLIYQFYTARYQIEFIFRDAKGFTGLADCQSRDAQRQHYHINASLTALNFVKIQDNEKQQKNKTQHPFSITNWVRKYHVEIVINQFIGMFKLDQTFIKSHPDYDSVLEFGNVKH